MPKVTISQIAKEAGVSKTAVSFAFNDPTQLSATTVQHIREIADRLGYTPDPIARSMTTRRTNALGLLLPQDIATALANPFFTQFIRGMGRVCHRTGQSLMLVPPMWGSVMKAIPHATVDGFVVVGLEVDRGELQLLRRRDVPFVMVDSDAPDDVPSVNVDDHDGARQIMQHVLGKGHRRIAIVSIWSGKSGHVEEYTGTLAARLAGYEKALHDYGLALDAPDVQVTEAPVSSDGGRAVFEKLWNTPTRPTAIVAMSDIIAIGVIDAARAQGLELPRDLSVVGFDDLPDASHVRPALTTVRQSAEEKGELATNLLVAALEKHDIMLHHMLPTELVVRESVADVNAVSHK